MGRGVKKIDVTAGLADKLSSVLAEFPTKPRGKLRGLHWASEQAAHITTTAADVDEGLRSAISFLREVRRQDFCDPATTQSRVPERVNRAHVGEFSDCQNQDVGARTTKETGQGNRTNTNRILEFINSFTEMQAAGVALPLVRIGIEHMKFPSFVAALDSAAYLQIEGIGKEDVHDLTFEALRKLRKRARYRLLQAGKAFSDK